MVLALEQCGTTFQKNERRQQDQVLPANNPVDEAWARLKAAARPVQAIFEKAKAYYKTLDTFKGIIRAKELELSNLADPEKILNHPAPLPSSLAQYITC